MAALTRSIKAGLALPFSLMTAETEPTEAPASLATSRMVYDLAIPGVPLTGYQSSSRKREPNLLRIQRGFWPTQPGNIPSFQSKVSRNSPNDAEPGTRHVQQHPKANLIR